MVAFSLGIGLLVGAVVLVFLWPGSSRIRIMLAGVAIVVLCVSAVLDPGRRASSIFMVVLGLTAIARELGFVGHRGNTSRV